MSEQPTAQQIVSSITELSIVFDIPGARAECMRELLTLRKAKTTWVGEDENKLRRDLDGLLDECVPGWRGQLFDAPNAS